MGTGQDRAIRMLIEWFDDRLLCPVIGAGLVADLNVPQWKPLVHGLAHDRRQILSQDADTVSLEHLYEMLRSDAPGLDDRMQSNLYSAVPRNWCRDPDFEEKAVFQVAQLAILVASRASGRPFHVLTYNLDTLLEEAVAALGHRACATVFDGNRLRKYNWSPATGSHRLADRSGLRQAIDVTIAHPHGLIPRPGSRGRRPMGVVMAAADYHDVRRYPHSGPSYWQLVCFTDCRVLFYGFSFSDDSVRYFVREGQKDVRKVGHRHVVLLKGPDRPTRSSNNLDRLKDRWFRGGRICRAGRDSYAQQRTIVSRVVEQLRNQEGFVLRAAPRPKR